MTLFSHQTVAFSQAMVVPQLLYGRRRCLSSSNNYAAIIRRPNFGIEQPMIIIGNGSRSRRRMYVVQPQQHHNYNYYSSSAKEEEEAPSSNDPNFNLSEWLQELEFDSLEEAQRYCEMRSDSEAEAERMMLGYVRIRLAASPHKHESDELMESQYWTIPSLLRDGNVSEARRLFEKLPKYYAEEWSCWMIHGYVWNGMLDEARNFFDDMMVKTRETWSAMICGYTCSLKLDGSNSYYMSEARRLFEEASPDIEKDFEVWSSMVKGYSSIGMLDEARIFFDRSPKKTSVCRRAMINGYMKRDMMSEAAKLFEAVPPHERNVSLWNDMICEFADKGMLEEARRYFDNTPKRTHWSYYAMIRGYIDHDNNIAEARSVYDQMPSFLSITWRTMMGAYIAIGNYKEAIRLFLIGVLTIILDKIVTSLHIGQDRDESSYWTRS